MPARQSNISVMQPSTALVVGARKFRFSTVAQSSSRIAWWDASTGPDSRELIPAGLKQVFVRRGLARGNVIKDIADRNDATLVEFQDEGEIFSALTKIIGNEANRAGEASKSIHAESTTSIWEQETGGKNPDFVLAIDRIVDVPVKNIRPNPNQPRTHFNKKSLLELGYSLTFGQEKPIILVEIPKQKDAYIICDGERRFRAAQIIGKPTLRAIIARSMEEADLFARSVVANFGTEPHTHIEIANALHKMRQGKNKLTIEQAARRCAMSAQTARNHLNLLRATSEVQTLLDQDLPDEERLDFLVVAEIGKLPAERQMEATRHILAKKMNLAQVRHYIAHLLAEIGSKNTDGRRRKPSDDVKVLATFIRASTEKLEQFLDLPGGMTIETLFRRRSWEDRDRTVAALDGLVERIKKIRGQIVKVDERRATA